MLALQILIKVPFLKSKTNNFFNIFYKIIKHIKTQLTSQHRK